VNTSRRGDAFHRQRDRLHLYRPGLIFLFIMFLLETRRIEHKNPARFNTLLVVNERRYAVGDRCPGPGIG
jgi:hypothetical protein